MSSHLTTSPAARPPQSDQALDVLDAARAEWEGLAGPSADDPGPGHSERRRMPRSVTGGEPSRAVLVSRTWGSYQEMPGLRLFAHQAARLFGISLRTCQLVLDDFVKEGRLRRDSRGQYVR